MASDHRIDIIGGNFYSNRSSDGANLSTKIKKRYWDIFITNVAEKLGHDWLAFESKFCWRSDYQLYFDGKGYK